MGVEERVGNATGMGWRCVDEVKGVGFVGECVVCVLLGFLITRS